MKIKWFMNSQLFIIFLIINVYSQSCFYLCSQCTNRGSYDCTSCIQTQGVTQFMWSCQNHEAQKSILFILFCVFIVLIHGFMILMGHGIYSQVFSAVQMASLITWGYGSQSGAYMLQGTNLALQYNNNFFKTFAPQFIVIMIIWVIFWILVILAYKFPRNPTATLILRKRLIFSTRLIAFFFNIIVYSSLIDLVTTTKFNQNYNFLRFFFSVLAIGKIIFVTTALGIELNLRKFNWDDPNYYVFIQKIKGIKWWIKNNVIFGFIIRAGILFAFIFGFSQPLTSGIIIMIFQSIRIVYTLIFLRYTKIRYFLINLFGNILLLFIILCSMGCGINTIGNSSWESFKIGYFSITLILCITLLLAQISQIFIMRQTIKRQIASFYQRYIICVKINANVSQNKYDQYQQRQPVTTFRKNLLYQQNIQLTGSKSKQRQQDVQRQKQSSF